MERTSLQQNELDRIESHVLISLFGSDRIPESTSIALRMMNINPNDYIHKFETIMLPVMDDDGMVDGKFLKKVIEMSKYREFAQLFTIPDNHFYLSDIVISILKSILPGIEP